MQHWLDMEKPEEKLNNKMEKLEERLNNDMEQLSEHKKHIDIKIDAILLAIRENKTT